METRVRGQYPGVELPGRELPDGYWHPVEPKHWGLPKHRNEGGEIRYLLSGETVFATDNQSVKMSLGDITTTRSWQCHCLEES